MLLKGRTAVFACVLVLLAVSGCSRNKDPLNAAKMELQRGRHQRAIELIDSADDKVRNTYDAQMVLATAHLRAGNREKSWAAFEKAADLDRTKVDPFLGMAESDIQQAGKATDPAEMARLQMSALDQCERALAIDDTSAKVYVIMARIRGQRGELQQALQAYQEAIKNDPENADWKAKKAVVHLRLREIAEASALVDEALAQDPACLGARVVKARILMSERKVEEAKKELRLAVAEKKVTEREKQLEQANARLILADLCLRDGETEEALKLGEELVKFDWSRGAGYLMMGKAHLKEGRPKEAYDAFKKLENVQDTRFLTEVLVGLAATEEQLGMTNQAIAHYQQITEKLAPTYLPAHQRIAALLLPRGQYDEALKHCEAILRERPGDPSALEIKAIVYSSPSRYRNYELAEQCYRRILAHNQNAAAIHLKLAGLYVDMRRPRQAMEHAMEATSREDNAQARLVLGRVHLLMHMAGLPTVGEQAKSNMDKAIENLARSRELDPANPNAVIYLANAYLADEQPEEAINILKPFLAQNTEIGQMHIMLARVYQGMKEPEKAIAVLENAAKVRDIKNFDPRALGQAYFLAGRYKDAIRTWRELITKDEAYRADLTVNIGLAVASALDEQYSEALTLCQTISHQTPTGSGAELVTACIAIQAGDFNRAKQFLQGSEHFSKKEEETYYQFVEDCRAAGDKGKTAAALISEAVLHSAFFSLDIAVERLEQAKALLPDSIIPYYVMSNTLLRAGRLQEVVALYDEMFAKFPSQGFPHLQLAQRAANLPTQADPREQLQQAVDLDPGLAAAHRLLARAIVAEAGSNGDLATIESAVKHAEEAVGVDGGTEESLAALVQARADLARSTRAEMLKESSPETRARKAEAVAKAEEQARASLRMLETKFPNSLVAARQGIRLELARERFREAADRAMRFLDSKGESQEIRQLAAMAFAGTGEFGKAVQQLERVVAANPANSGASIQLANLYERVGRADRALSVLDRARQIQPGEPVLTFMLARMLIEHGQVARAKVEYENILAKVPADSSNPRVAAVHNAALLGLADTLIKMPARDAAEKSDNLTQAVLRLKSLTDPLDGKEPDPAALLQLGKILEEQNLPLRALSAYEKCIEINPEYYPAYQAIMRLLYSRSEYDKGMSFGRDTTLAKWPANPSVRAMLALTLLAHGAPEDMENALTLAAETMSHLQSISPSALRQEVETPSFHRTVLVLTLIAGERYADARNYIKAILDMEPVRLESWDQLVDICSRDSGRRRALVANQGAGLFFKTTGDTDRVIDALKKANEAIPDNPYLLSRLADAQRAGGEIEQAAATINKLLNTLEQSRKPIQSPYHEQLYTMLIDMYLGSLAQTTDDAIKKGIALCERGVEKWPRNVAFLGRLAMAYRIHGETAKCVATWNEVIRISTEGSAPWINAKKQLAGTYYFAGQVREAADVFDNIEKYVETDSGWLNDGAWFHANAPDPDLRRAVELARSAVRLSPANASVRDTLGWIYHLAGSYDQAEFELEYAAQELPQNANVLYHLAANQVKVGKLKEADETLKKALDLHRTGRSTPPLTSFEACKALLEEVGRKLKTQETP